VNMETIGWMLVAGGVVWLLATPWIVRRRIRAQTHRLHFILAAIATVADAHRQTCRALITLGKHTECPVCHVDERLWEEVIPQSHRSMHIVALAKHQSWLDPNVEITRIVADQYRATEGGRRL
jgi:pimeloyl-ACP methyl ester carboxylesterase